MAIDPVRVKLEEAAERADSAASAFYQVLTNDRDTPVPVEGGTVDSMAKRIYDQVGGAIDTLEQAAVDAAAAVVTANSAVATATAKADEASASADAANTAKTDAQAARDLAQASATAANTSAGTATTKATEAAASATSAAASAGNAATSAGAAASSANSAQDSATSAATSAGTATAAASAATTAKNDAVSAKDAAVVAKTAAETAAGASQSSATSATASAGAAATSAATATTKASEAAASATAANAAKTAAEQAKSDAQTSAQNAAFSASSVIAYRDAAVSAANAAHDSELSAAASALTAQDSADSAEIHAADAQASATASSNSAAAAEASKTSAQDSAIEAANSAATATTKAVDAENSAATAAAKAGDAATSANAANAAQAAAEVAKDEAQTSAQNAAISEANAQSSEQNALISANAAASSAAEVNGLADSLRAEIATKVDKVAGKGLSTNDFTNEAKATLEETAENQLRTPLHFDTLADIFDAAPNLAVGQIVESLYDEMRYDIDEDKNPVNERPIVKVNDYSKIREYTGRATRLRVIDNTGSHWWVRRGTAPDNGGTVLIDALGRSWEREYSGAVNVRWFGAKGDGVTDDTVAFQTALDTGFDVFVPCSTNEVYIVGALLTINNRGQRLFGNQINGKTSSGSATGFIKFVNDRVGVSCILVTAHQVYIEGITFQGNNRIAQPNTCIGFTKLINTDDMDGYVSSCNFTDFESAVVHVGRGLRFTMNSVSLCRYGVIHDWPTDGVEVTAPEQALPFGDRAFEITNNRFHIINQYAIYSKSPILRGALISSNINDLGEGLLRVDGDIVQSNITNNITEGAQAACIRTYGDVIGVNISNNVFAGTPSGIGMDTQNPPFAFNATGSKSVKGLIFSGNTISDINYDAILFGSGMDIQGLSIIGNTFKNIGKDGDPLRACIRSSSSINGASIIGNSFYPVTAPMVFRTTTSSETLTNVKAGFNNYIASGGFNNGAFTDGGGNEMQS